MPYRRGRSFPRRRRRVQGHAGRSSSARATGRSRSVRHTMRRGGRRPLNVRNQGRASTRALAKRAFATRGLISVTEYRQSGAPAITLIADGNFVGVQQPEGVLSNNQWNNVYTESGSGRVRWDGFGEDTLGRFVELFPGYNGNPQLCSPIFNCYTGTGLSIPGSTNYIRVLRHRAFLSFRLQPNNLNSFSTEFGSNSRPVTPDLPQRVYVRIIGMRVDVGDRRDPNDIGILPDGAVNCYLPAYRPESSGLLTYESWPTKDMLVPEATLSSMHPNDFLTARFPDYNDRHAHERKMHRRIILDKVFTLHYPYAVDGNNPGSGQNLLNLGYRQPRSFYHRMRIDFPAHSVRLLDETSPFDSQQVRQTQYRFFMCVKQAGFSRTTTASPTIRTQAHVNHPVSIECHGKSKSWYTVPPAGGITL